MAVNAHEGTQRMGTSGRGVPTKDTLIRRVIMGKLTTRSVEGFAKRKGRYSDGDGLFLRVLDPGKRVYWTYRYVVGGKERETSLGALADIKLEQARIKHAELRADVLKRVDPRGDRRGGKGIVVKAGMPTFGAMADKFIAAHEGGWKNRKHARQWDATLRKYAAPLRDMPVDQIATADVLACLSPIWNERPETGSRVRGRIEVILASAAVAGHIPEDRPNPARWQNWLDLMLANPKKVGKPRGHYKALPYKEVPALMAKLAKIDTAASRALRLTILCATRTNETIGARWEEISFDDNVWSIPASRMKMKRPHDIPLSDQAVDILRVQHEARDDRNPHVFPGRPMRSLSDMTMAMIFRKLGVDATVHGCRTSFRTWAADVDHAPFEVAEAALAHTIGNEASQAYNRTTMTERRRPVMERWGRYICGAEIVTLKRGAA